MSIHIGFLCQCTCTCLTTYILRLCSVCIKFTFLFINTQKQKLMYASVNNKIIFAMYVLTLTPLKKKLMSHQSLFRRSCLEHKSNIISDVQLYNQMQLACCATSVCSFKWLRKHKNFSLGFNCIDIGEKSTVQRGFRNVCGLPWFGETLIDCFIQI